MTIEAIAILSTGLVLFFISLPLVYRKVPMNSVYGIRIPAAFESDQRWYDINAYGGRQLAAWSGVITVVGAAGFFLPENCILIYLPISTAVVLLAILIPLIRITRWSRQLPSSTSKTSSVNQNEISQTSGISRKSNFLGKRTLIPALALGFLCVGYLILVMNSAVLLQTQVATHFDAAGKPNGWMSRQSYLHFIATLGFTLALVIGGFGFILGILIGRLKPPQWNHETASKRQPQNLSWLGGDILWLACWILCFVAGTHYLTIEANRSQPAHLPAASLGILIVGFGVGNVGWIILLCLHLLKKPVVPGEYEIKITFSKEMRDHSWSWSSAWKNSTPEFIGAPAYDAVHKTCSVKVKLEPDKTYGFWLNSQNFHNFKDTQGHPAVPYLLVFQTKGN